MKFATKYDKMISGVKNNIFHISIGVDQAAILRGTHGERRRVGAE